MKKHAAVRPLSSSQARTRGLARKSVLPVLVALALCGCGGGGGSPGTNLSPVPQEVPPLNVGNPFASETIQSSALSENFCAVPRTGTDPATGQPYRDKPGSIEQEKSWVRAWIDETYLWFDEIAPTIRTSFYATPVALFADLRTLAVTPSGKARDQFHFTYPTDVWRALSVGGIEAGYGFDIAIVKTQPPREVRVAYTEPGTPAAAAGINRGVQLLAVDGVDIVNGNSVAALNAALFPSAAGQAHTFKLQELDGSVRNVSLTSAQITKVPVQNVKTIDTPTGKVGYFQFNDHVGTSEAQLISAMETFKALGVRDLVVDIRYNGGGLLSIASELAYMIATPAATAGKTFEKLQFNRKNPFGLTDAQTTTPFYSTAAGFSAPAGRALPQLGLSRVTVLTGPDTCSASEAIVNGLRGVNVEVNLIGNTTCGKPYGFLPQDNCGTTYFAIQFKGVNNQGFGDYADGLAPTCAVADDFSHALGDPAERRLAAALGYLATGLCPAAASGLAKSSVLGTGGEPLLSGKSPARTSRILRAGPFSSR